MDCVYSPNTGTVMGELSYNIVGENQPYDQGTADPKKFKQISVIAVDQVMYCRLQRAIKPADSKILDASNPNYLLLVRGPANYNG